MASWSYFKIIATTLKSSQKKSGVFEERILSSCPFGGLLLTELSEPIYCFHKRKNVQW